VVSFVLRSQTFASRYETNGGIAIKGEYNRSVSVFIEGKREKFKIDNIGSPKMRISEL